MHGQISFYWIWAAVFAAATAYALYRFLASVRRDRFFADTPLVRIRSAAQGYVRLEGRAGPPDGENPLAPLSGRPAVWWDYQISKKYRNSKGETRWESADTESSVAPFTLTDADGRCLVGPVGAEIIPTSDDTWYGSTPRPHGPPSEYHVRQVMEEAEYRYTERLIAPGTLVSVLGELRSQSEVSQVDEQVRALLDSWKKDQVSLLQRFDKDHDGRLEAEEWEAARVAARTEVQGAALCSVPGRVSVLGGTTHGEPFLIAPLNEQQLVRREQRYALASLVASVVFVVLAAWAIENALAP